MLTLLAPAVSALQSGPLTPVFERVWQTGREQVYPGTLESRFSDEVFADLSRRAAQAATFEELAHVINPFLSSLGISHTRFYHDRDPDYHFMRALFSTRDPDSHPIWHIGMQVLESADGYRVREILEGYPAEAAGLRRGDRLRACGEKAFHAMDCFRDGQSVTLTVERNGRVARIEVRPVFESPARSYIQAMKNSVRILSEGGRRIGYLHFWMGAFEENLQEYDRIIRQDLFLKTDALILDLRGGFGGASLERVDPFFPDRSTYPVMRGVLRDGSLTPPERWEPRQNPNPYTKPMVVLINEGVRSGKEMMAFQFKKSGRAVLFGTSTAGMFVAGRMWFAEEREPYMFYLAARGALLDGINLEGVGVAPDRVVPYPTDRTLAYDPQLNAALTFLGDRLEQSGLPVQSGG
ncbi:MAG: S41 family peptidase [Bdellovibrionales bacterium]